eukprot:465722-Rhodomonas_salina.1
MLLKSRVNVFKLASAKLEKRVPSFDGRGRRVPQNPARTRVCIPGYRPGALHTRKIPARFH